MSTTSFRWESELSQSVQDHVQPTLWTRYSTGTWVRAFESTCSEGRADIVWGRFEPGTCPTQFGEHSTLLQNATASRILAAMRKRASQSERDLQAKIGVTSPVLRKWLRDLVDTGLVVKTRNDRYRAASNKVFRPIEICSFELKLKDWRRALYQATRYRSFSHRVFVVMPCDSAQAAYTNKAQFCKANVGLIAHDITGRSKVLIRPSKREPQAGYRSIMALGMLSQLPVTAQQSLEMIQ
jgi:hypothetical protein